MNKNSFIYAATLATASLIYDVYAMLSLGQGLGRLIQGVVQFALLFFIGYFCCLLGSKKAINESVSKQYFISGLYTWAIFGVAFRFLYGAEFNGLIVFFTSMSIVVILSYVAGAYSGINNFLKPPNSKQPD